MINDFGIYLLKVSLLLGVMYAVFELFFSRTTLFTLNRAYLLCAFVFAFVIPLVTISGDPNINNVSELWPLIGEHPPEHDMAFIILSDENSTRPFDYDSIMLMAYIAGACVLLMRSIFTMFRLSVWIHRGPGKKLRRARVVRSQTNYSFSFFNVLFLSPLQDDHAVIVHEKAHIAQLHWIDLLIAEIAVTILWFNPVAWLMKKNIRLQHEYLADEVVLKKGTSIQRYLLTILKSALSEETAVLINQFSSNPLKNRIVMMTRNKTTDLRKLSYFFTLPLVAFLLFAFAKRDQHYSYEDTPITVVIDASHGGDDKGAVAGSATEKELSLALAGMIRSACLEKGVNVVMTRSNDQSVSLADRISTAGKVNADLFISVHIGFDDDPSVGGVDCLISKDNAQYKSSLAFSSLLMENLKSVVSVNGLKNSSAHVLKQNPAAAVVLELGYLSNEKDRVIITDPETQKVIGQRVAAAIVAYSK
jgi:N-acetylmuramoyl-L-alanine amidase